ncbi:hypothetical protein VE01_01449 [Pseudogymnoascus verrucosus]|uniref:Telomerase Cajal body protein 1 n=1 Tax=Pseudogymnoascus verrucosus TaxID=342668 RepID=A0A1B8GWT8_9PEZI|nr:uncharacterized protein VE01_01449 [Pseudogymnoascus verrucosus]OBU00279.1 hypothetical protein VE01_01449 [Pseudogymnoascus verrucosus]
MDAELCPPQLVATTSSTYSCSIEESRKRELEAREDSTVFSPVGTAQDGRESNYFKSIQWSPDGTSLIAASADNKLRFYVAPPDLLSPSSSPHILTPYTTYAAPEPTYTQSFYPHFDLQNSSTTVLLSSPRDHPIQLINVLSPEPSPVSTYSLVCRTTEAYLTPSSLLWHPSGQEFYTGTDCLISIFDVSRSGEGPTTRLPTIPSKRHKMKGGGVGMRGIVSCLSLQPDAPDSPLGNGMLAAGTWTRWVSLYDAEGLGGTVANWSIASAADDESQIGGAGVSQVLWSACGRYLFVVERKSRGVLVYDVRVTGRLVGWLEGREAETNQRMSVDTASIGGKSEVWAGGTDGRVRVWRDVGSKERGAKPDMDWLAHEEGTTVGGLALHSCGSVVATASGMRRERIYVPETDSDSESESEDDSSDDSDVSDKTTKTLSETSTICSSHQELTEDNTIKLWSIL